LFHHGILLDRNTEVPQGFPRGIFRPAKKTDLGIAHLRFSGSFFFIIGPDKMILGADVKGLIKARSTPALLLIDLFLFAWRGLLDGLLNRLDVVIMPICHLLPLDGIVLPQIIQ